MRRLFYFLGFVWLAGLGTLAVMAGARGNDIGNALPAIVVPALAAFLIGSLFRGRKAKMPKRELPVPRRGTAGGARGNESTRGRVGRSLGSLFGPGLDGPRDTAVLNLAACSKCGAGFPRNQGKKRNVKVGVTSGGLGGSRAVYGRRLLCPDCARWHDFWNRLGLFIGLAILITLALLI